MKARRWLILPIEIQARELHSKLLLALHAAARGWGVVIGHAIPVQQAIDMLPRGVYLDKSVTAARAPAFERFRRLGHRVVAWCEEGLVILDAEDYRERRLSADSLAQVDLFLAWGANQAAMVAQAHPAAAPRVKLCGNPRVDLLREPVREYLRTEVEALRQRYGPFVLINTNFGFFNRPGGPSAVIESMRKQGKIRSAAQEAKFREWAEYKGELFRHFQTMTRELAAEVAPAKVILRPHPTEDPSVWVAALRGAGNIEVIPQGVVTPWLCAASMVVHNSCTTGVEARLLDRPVAAYMPVTSERFDCGFPNGVSARTASVQDLAALAKRALAGEPQGLPPADALLDAHLANWRNGGACEAIMDELDRVQTDAAPLDWSASNRLRFAARCGLREAGLWRSALEAKILGRASVRAYQRRKFPPLARAALETSARQFGSLAGTGEIAVEELGPNVFTIQPRR